MRGVATGLVSEQGMKLHNGGATLVVRRITIVLDRPTESGGTEIHVLTNLTSEQAIALQVAENSRPWWTVEGAFRTLTDVLRCEVEALGDPKAALFSFATAVLAYNVYAVVKASLREAHGAVVIRVKLFDYYFTNNVAKYYIGMYMTVAEEDWDPYQKMSMEQFAEVLLELAHRVKLTRSPKTKRGPKKPQPRKTSGLRNHHISTARVFAKR